MLGTILAAPYHMSPNMQIAKLFAAWSMFFLSSKHAEDHLSKHAKTHAGNSKITEEVTKRSDNKTVHRVFCCSLTEHAEEHPPHYRIWQGDKEGADFSRAAHDDQ